jgi:RNA polymerase sigma-70 factor (ECF subfamily)
MTATAQDRPAGAGAVAVVETLFRRDSRRVLATLIRLLGGDFDRAEEAMHEAFRAALEQWPREGVPANPRAWLVSTGRFRAIDALRRRARFEARLDPLVEQIAAEHADPAELADEEIADDRLRLVFTCCHPALPREAQLALTLREVCGLRTEEIARALLARPAAVAQRIVRAKAKIRDARIPYEVPAAAERATRLDAVLQVVYLLFNEGYSASEGECLTRPDLSSEAIRLARLPRELTAEPEVLGLLALMLLHESRREVRLGDDGDVVLLEDQDRRRWDRALIDEGLALVPLALAGRPVGAYAIQAAIAALHAEAPTAEATDWPQIEALYALLARLDDSPVVALNRAVALAMCAGAAAGLERIELLLGAGDAPLADYHLAHAARADLLRRLGRTGEARAAYRRALELARLQPERRFLARRLRELED